MRPLELSWVPSSGFQQQNSQSNPKNAFNKINIYSDFIKVLIFLSKLYHFVGNQLLFMLHLKLSSCHRCLLLPHNAVSLGKLMLVQRRTLPGLSYFGRIFSHLILEFLKLRVANFKASYRGIIGITKSRTFLPFILSNGVVIRLSLWKQNNLRNKIRWIYWTIYWEFCQKSPIGALLVLSKQNRQSQCKSFTSDIETFF